MTIWTSQACDTAGNAGRGKRYLGYIHDCRPADKAWAVDLLRRIQVKAVDNPTLVSQVIPTAYATTGLTGIPAAFIAVALILALFATAYVTMARHIVNAGAFYAFIARSLYLRHCYTGYGSPIQLPGGPRMYPMIRQPHHLGQASQAPG